MVAFYKFPIRQQMAASPFTSSETWPGPGQVPMTALPGRCGTLGVSLQRTKHICTLASSRPLASLWGEDGSAPTPKGNHWLGYFSSLLGIIYNSGSSICTEISCMDDSDWQIFLAVPGTSDVLYLLGQWMHMGASTQQQQSDLVQSTKSPGYL